MLGVLLYMGAATFTVDGVTIHRSVLTPVQVYRGTTFRVVTRAGVIERKPFYGAAMALQYVSRPRDALRGRQLEERLECVYENYRTGLPRRWSAPFSVDERGVWTDVLAFGAEKPLPDDIVRIVRQELLLDGRVFAVNTILFRAESLEFRPHDWKRVSAVERKLERYRQGKR